MGNMHKINSLLRFAFLIYLVIFKIGIDPLRVAIDVVNHNLRPKIPKYVKEPFSILIKKCWN